MPPRREDADRLLDGRIKLPKGYSTERKLVTALPLTPERLRDLSLLLSASWLLADCMDPTTAKRLREKGKPRDPDVCSMCGEYCVFRMQDELD